MYGPVADISFMIQQDLTIMPSLDEIVKTNARSTVDKAFSCVIWVKQKGDAASTNRQQTKWTEISWPHWQ